MSTTAATPPTYPNQQQWRASLRNRFRVRVGKHIQKEPLFDEAGNPVIDENPESRNFGKQVLVNRVYQARTDHDVIETNKDLVAIFNSPGSEKFERVHADDHRASVPVPGVLPVYQQGHNAQAFQPSPAQVAQQAAAAQAATRTPANPNGDTLDSMTVKELQAFAAAEEISLPEPLTRQNAKKDDVLKAIRAAAPR